MSNDIGEGVIAPNQEKILVVEDSRLFRQTMEKTLCKAGYLVSTANDGDQAIHMARRLRPDAILLDILLPKMTGLDVLKALKSDNLTSDIPVIVLTGLSPMNAAKLQKDGAAAYLEKNELIFAGQPGVASILVATVDRVLRERTGPGKAAN